MTDMTTNELKKCSGCKTLILLKYFKINRKGDYNKTCLSCADKRKKSYNKLKINKEVLTRNTEIKE